MPARPDRRRQRAAPVHRPRRTRPEPTGAPAAATPMPWFERLQQIATVIAPTTLVTALLAYFGYLATRARFEYFGVYLDLVDLSTSDLLLYGSEVVFVPIVLGSLATLAAIGARHLWERMTADERHHDLAVRVAVGCVLTG